MTATAAPIPGFALARPQATPALAFAATLPAEALTERHRPATLAAMVGQGAAVYQLGLFVDAPAPRAFLFAGPTGVGKTTAARALANDLGISIDWGFHVIRSAEADADAVDDALRMLRHACPVGSGWKMVLVDEADLMTPKASHLWLSALEDLPPRSVVVFTTNRPEHFPDRFLDRCERLDFAADGNLLAQDAEDLIDRIWLAETGRTDPPRFTEIPGLIDKHGRISFRRVVAALDPMVRASNAKRGRVVAAETPAPPPAPPAVASAPAPAPIVAPVADDAPSDPPAAPPTLALVRPPTPRKPAPRPKPVPTPAPAPVVALAIDSAARDDARLADLDREYVRLGNLLMGMDREMNEIRARQKARAKRSRRA